MTPPGANKPHQSVEAGPRVRQVVQHPEGGDEAEGSVFEWRLPEVRAHDDRIGQVGQVARRALHGVGAVERDHGVEVGCEEPGVATPAAAGVEAHHAVQACRVEVAQVVLLGVLLVLVPHLGEGRPFVAEALERAGCGVVHHGVARRVDVTPHHRDGVARRAAQRVRLTGHRCAAAGTAHHGEHPVEGARLDPQRPVGTGRGRGLGLTAPDGAGVHGFGDQLSQLFASLVCGTTLGETAGPVGPASPPPPVTSP